MKAVCGFKDSEGVFWDTEELCTASEERIRINKVKQNIKDIQDRFIQEYVLNNSSAVSYNTDEQLRYGYYVSETRLEFNINGTPITRYIKKDVYQFALGAFSYIARHSELFQQLRDAFIEIGDIIDKEPVEIQPELASTIVEQSKEEVIQKDEWWKFW